MIYLDHNATTTIRPAVIEYMIQVMHDTGNASSTHAAGRRASSILEKAREQVANAVNTRPAQVIFTSCATESINTILKTFKGERILASAVEHAAILECGLAELEIIPVDHSGLIDMAALDSILSCTPTAMVNVMMVNNETGVIQPIKDIAKIVHKHNSLLHVDAVQALGKIPVDFKDSGADYMSFSAHKIGGPQGVGCFIFAAQKPVRPLLLGGKQEKRQRAGTVNVAGAAGMGMAAELAVSQSEDYESLCHMRDTMEAKIKQALPSVVINGTDALRVGNCSSLTYPGVTNTVQIMNLDLEKICVSGGSACSSGVAKPSHVLKAMGLSDEDALATIRVSLGWNTTQDDVNSFIEKYIKIIERVGK